MSTQQLNKTSIEDVCRRIDNYVVCGSDAYMVYFKYKIGESPSIRQMNHVLRLQNILCREPNFLCDSEKERLVQHITSDLL